MNGEVKLMQYVFMRYPEGRAKAVTFSYDDGTVQDKRLAELFTRFGLRATFNFCDTKHFTREDLREVFLSKGHEIAVHGLCHRACGSTRPIEGIRDVLDCRLHLEEECGRIIRGMAYPDTGITRMGSFVDFEDVKCYLSMLGIAYVRTLAGDNNAFRLPEEFYAWMPTAHHNNPNLFDWIEEFLTLDLSPDCYHAIRDPRLFYLWGHSYELDADGTWDRMEEICAKLSGHEDVWYATNLEIYEYVEAYGRLVYSADGRRVYNPTLHTLWLDADGVSYRIGSGETVLIGG